MGRAMTRGPRWSVWAALGLGLGLISSCAGLSSWEKHASERDFEQAQKRYTRLMRWAEFDRAREFVDPEQRDAFLATATRLSEIRFTDYAVRSKEVEPEQESASVRVTYRAYRVSSMIETTFEEHQQWHRDNATGLWRVRSEWVEQIPGRTGPES